MNLIILLSLLAIGLLTYSFRVPKALRAAPRVSFWGFTIALLSKVTLHDFYTKLLGPKLKEKGYATLFWIGKWIVVIDKPEIASTFYKNTALFTKQLNDAHGIFAKFMGTKNIVNSNGDDWKRFRKPANPIFHQTFQPEIFAPCVNGALNLLAQRVSENNREAITATDLLQWMTLDVLGKGIFSVDFEAVKSNGTSRYNYLYHNILKQVFNPLYFFFPFLNKYPFGKMKEAHGHVREFNGFIKGLIEERRADLKEDKYQDSKDLLTTLLKANEESQYEPLTDEELIHSVNIFFIAGHDTTANSLSYAMYHLAKNQDVQDKLRKEINEVLNIKETQDTVVVPTLEQLKNMEYLGLVIKETMRITPPVGLLNRILADDYAIPGDNIVIPKGTVVGLSIYAIHHDPKHFKNPEKFEPERFLNTKYDTDVYMPFGGGSRMCIGTNFSLIEQKVYLSMLIQKFMLNIGKSNPDYNNLRIRGLGLNRPQDLKLNFVPRF